MKKLILIMMFSFLMLLPVNIKALCTYNDKAILRKKASNVIPSYTYKESEDGVSFSITLTNLSSDIYIIDKTTGIRYPYNNSSELTIDGYSAGSKIQYEIYAVDSNCIAKYLTIKYVNLPNYNKYYKDPLCVGKENYSVCYKWNKVDITYDEFKKRVNTLYNESIKEEPKEEELTIFDKIYNFLHDYYIFIFIGLTVIVFGIIMIRNKKNDFGF